SRRSRLSAQRADRSARELHREKERGADLLGAIEARGDDPAARSPRAARTQKAGPHPRGTPTLPRRAKPERLAFFLPLLPRLRPGPVAGLFGDRRCLPRGLSRGTQRCRQHPLVTAPLSPGPAGGLSWGRVVR